MILSVAIKEIVFFKVKKSLTTAHPALNLSVGLSAMLLKKHVLAFFIEIFTYPLKSTFTQGGRGHWVVYYTCPQSYYNVFLLVGLITLETFIEL